MIKIKMNDISEIEADYENMKIHLLDDRGMIIQSIQCLSSFDTTNTLEDLTKHFEKDLKGSKMLVCFPAENGFKASRNVYKKGSLFMDLSSREKL